MNERAEEIRLMKLRTAVLLARSRETRARAQRVLDRLRASLAGEWRPPRQNALQDRRA
jgi:hypothetical protein